MTFPPAMIGFSSAKRVSLPASIWDASVQRNTNRNHFGWNQRAPKPHLDQVLREALPSRRLDDSDAFLKPGHTYTIVKQHFDVIGTLACWYTSIEIVCAIALAIRRH